MIFTFSTEGLSASRPQAACQLHTVTVSPHPTPPSTGKAFLRVLMIPDKEQKLLRR